MSEEAEKIIREILEIVEKERKECSWEMFDRDDTPWGGFEWACERIYEAIADRFQIKETESQKGVCEVAEISMVTDDRNSEG
jgi:hypothetical protein